jgi:hypothetical protein
MDTNQHNTSETIRLLENDAATHTDQQILAFAIGMATESTQNYLADYENDEPFVTLLRVQKKPTWKPTRLTLNNEVQRRYFDYDSKPSKRKPGANWTVENCVLWLKDHPIQLQEDIAYVTNAVDLLKDSLHHEKDKLNRPSQWRGHTPYLRLIHCLTDDEKIRSAYVDSFDALNRLELDAPRGGNVYDMIANKWNDKDFNPSTDMFPALHSDFGKTIELDYKLVAHLKPATSDKVKEKLSEMRVVLSNILSNHEQSGNGEGGNTEGASNQDDLSAYLNKNPSYILYLHEKTKTTIGKLRTTVIQRMNVNNVGLLSHGHTKLLSHHAKRKQTKKRSITPTPESEEISNNLKRKEEAALTVAEAMQKSSERIASSNNSKAKSDQIISYRQSIAKLKSEVRGLQLKLITDAGITDQGQSIINNQIEEVNEEIEMYKKIVSELEE